MQRDTLANNLQRIKKLSDATRVEINRPTWFEIYVVAIGHKVP